MQSFTDSSIRIWCNISNLSTQPQPNSFIVSLFIDIFINLFTYLFTYLFIYHANRTRSTMIKRNTCTTHKKDWLCYSVIAVVLLWWFTNLTYRTEWTTYYFAFININTVGLIKSSRFSIWTDVPEKIEKNKLESVKSSTSVRLGFCGRLSCALNHSISHIS